MTRSLPPAPSSVVNISEKAVESHASSGRPVRFLKPKMAMERRGLAEAATESLDLEGARTSRKRRSRTLGTLKTKKTAAISRATAAKRGTQENRCGITEATTGEALAVCCST